MELREAVKQGNYAEVKKWLPKIKQKSVLNFMLRIATHYGHLNIVQLLTEQGADIHHHSEYCLRWASLLGHQDIIKFLYQKGVDIHVHNDTVAVSAAELGYLDIVKMLLKIGLSNDAKNRMLIKAAAGGHLDTVKYFS